MSSFDTFNEVQEPLLRAYNRAVMALNLNVDEGKECASRYLSMFSDKENAAIYALKKMIRPRYGMLFMTPTST